MKIMISKAKMKDLARKTARQAFSVKYPNNYQVGQARKAIEKMIGDDHWKYVTNHGKYCTPNENLIISDGAALLTPQSMMFQLEEVDYGK